MNARRRWLSVANRRTKFGIKPYFFSIPRTIVAISASRLSRSVSASPQMSRTVLAGSMLAAVVAMGFSF